MNESVEQDEREMLDANEALALLPEGATIHTIRSSGALMVGADWSRQSLVEAILTSACEIAGPVATEMGHGLVVHCGSGPLFVKTDPTALRRRLS